ncbi:MAG TPA: ankyrin repeat domain-containing protein [Candidatus Megaira endosymbiont of Nemacystus decipiens]|nr:ankyrin repeat domain-containing protein [Candidatus Megaera endosymbiont of Nemacystus decipiens]
MNKDSLTSVFHNNWKVIFENIVKSDYVNIFALNQALENIQNIEQKEKYIKSMLVDLVQNERVTVEIIDWAIAKGADVNYITRISKNTPLMCLAGNPAVTINMMDCLIKNGARVDAENKDGDTVLHFLVEKDYFDENALEWIIEKGAKVNALDDNGDTPLMRLAGNPAVTTNIMDCLVSKGAKVNARNKNGETALHVLAFNKNVNLKTLKCLVGNDADIHAIDEEGNSILHWLAYNNNLDTKNRDHTKLLDYVIQKGIDINLKNDYEEVVLHLLANNENVTTEILNWAIKNGAYIHARDNEGSTPLSILVCNPNNSVEKVKCITQSKQYDIIHGMSNSNVLTGIMSDYNPDIGVFKYLVSQGFVDNFKIEADEFSELFQYFTNTILEQFEITNNVPVSEEVKDISNMLKGLFSSYVHNNSDKKDALIASNFKFCNHNFTVITVDNLKKFSNKGIGEIDYSVLENKKYILDLMKVEVYTQIGCCLLEMCEGGTKTLLMSDFTPSEEFMGQINFISENLKNLENEICTPLIGNNTDM